MIHDAPLLKQQMAAIEAKVREHLRGTRRRRAFEQAMRFGVWSLPAMAMLSLLIGWFVVLRPLAVLAAAAILAAGTFASTFVLRCGRERLPRREALALVDQRLRLKDRLQAADEFLADEHLDGFRQAALQEAAPWIARAQDRSLAEPRRKLTHGVGSLWPALLAAIVLLVLSFVQQRVFPPTSSEARNREQGYSPRTLARQAAAILQIAAPQGGEVRRERSSLPVGNSLQPSSRGAESTPSQQAQSSEGQAEQAHAGDPSGAGGATQSGGSSSASGSNGTPAAKGQAGRSGAAFGPSARYGRSDAAPQEPQTALADARIAADESRAADDRGARPSGSSHQSPGSSGSQAPSSSPLGSQRPNENKSGEGQGQKRSSQQSQPGHGQQSGQNSSNGGDSQGQRSGQDALKVSRGSSAMLLAVPMEDRLGGMASPGMVDSVGRKATPHAVAAARASAQERGTALGDLGRLGHRPRTPEERRLLQDYFRPAGTTGR